MARCLGVDRTTVIAWTGKPDFPGGKDGPWLLSDVFQWIVKRGKNNGLASDDPLMEGGESEWLEKYRKEKTLSERMNRRLKKGNLIPREKVHSSLARMSGIMRRGVDVLQRQFGPEAHAIMSEVFDDVEREIESLASDSETETEQPAV